MPDSVNGHPFKYQNCGWSHVMTGDLNRPAAVAESEKRLGVKRECQQKD